MQATDGNFYGTTVLGGANTNSCPGLFGCGTVFKITTQGQLTTLHNFDGGDGQLPQAELVLATDGNLYGTTDGGGPCPGQCGTVFKITPEGNLTTLHIFDGSDGFEPRPLVQGTDGIFYGTTYHGGDDRCQFGCGTVFSLNVGLGPFVETRPTSGKGGATIEILGTDLKDASSVTFDGAASNFNVVSNSEITASVPAEASAGKVEVVTPTGTLSSNVVFRVTQ